MSLTSLLRPHPHSQVDAVYCELGFDLNKTRPTPTSKPKPTPASALELDKKPKPTQPLKPRKVATAMVAKVQAIKADEDDPPSLNATSDAKKLIRLKKPSNIAEKANAQAATKQSAKEVKATKKAKKVEAVVIKESPEEMAAFLVRIKGQTQALKTTPLVTSPPHKKPIVDWAKAMKQLVTFHTLSPNLSVVSGVSSVTGASTRTTSSLAPDESVSQVQTSKLKPRNLQIPCSAASSQDISPVSPAAESVATMDDDDDEGIDAAGVNYNALLAGIPKPWNLGPISMPPTLTGPLYVIKLKPEVIAKATNDGKEKAKRIQPQVKNFQMQASQFLPKPAPASALELDKKPKPTQPLKPRKVATAMVTKVQAIEADEDDPPSLDATSNAKKSIHLKKPSNIAEKANAQAAAKQSAKEVKATKKAKKVEVVVIEESPEEMAAFLVRIKGQTQALKTTPLVTSPPRKKPIVDRAKVMEQLVTFHTLSPNPSVVLGVSSVTGASTRTTSSLAPDESMSQVQTSKLKPRNLQIPCSAASSWDISPVAPPTLTVSPATESVATMDDDDDDDEGIDAAGVDYNALLAGIPKPWNLGPISMPPNLTGPLYVIKLKPEVIAKATNDGKEKAKRIRPQVKNFQMQASQFLGYGPEENTWEPESNFQGSQKLILKFHKKFPDAAKPATP
ncbi:hypothetical protein RSAG8_12652, partial [Rhizoctonia solani AG-8 WAC10335]